jgi:anti-sigma B factor antagonist
MAFAIKVRQIDSAVALDLYGRLVHGQPVEGLRDVMHELLGGGSRLFVLNLSRVSYIDSAGLGQILAVYTSVRGYGGRVALLGQSKRAEQLLQLAKLATVFDICDDEVEAIDALTNGAAVAGSYS